MKQVVEDLYSTVPPGGIAVYARSMGKIDRSRRDRWLPSLRDVELDPERVTHALVELLEHVFE